MIGAFHQQDNTAKLDADSKLESTLGLDFNSTPHR